MIASENIRGAILMSCSMLGFALNDGLMKYAASDLPATQAIFIRGIFATLFVFAIVSFKGQLRFKISGTDRKYITWRALAELAATLTFITALFNMPLANVTAILQLLPLTISLAAFLVLAEPLGRTRLFAICVGFAGALLIVKPGTDGFTYYTLLALAAVAFVTFRDLVVRKISKEVPSLWIVLYASLLITVSTGMITWVRGNWVAVDGHTLMLLIFASCLIMVAYFFSVATMRHGEVSFIAPFRFSIMLWAVLIGYLVFNHLPDFLTLLGTAIVVAMGSFTLWRESRAKKRPV